MAMARLKAYRLTGMTRRLGGVLDFLLFWLVGLGRGGSTAFSLLGWGVALATFKGLSFAALMVIVSVLIPSVMVIELLAGS